MSDELYELGNEIRFLYAKTKCRALENLFCRYATSYEENFRRWLDMNSSMASALSHPDTYRALQLLSKLKNDNPSGISSSELVRYFTSNKSVLTLLPTILAFIPLLNSDVESILSPYADIILACNVFSEQQPTVSASSVSEDLKVIYDAFKEFVETNDSKSTVPSKRHAPSHRVTKNDLRTKMLSYLLKRFSEDIAKAAEEAGLIGAASRLRSGAVLLQPSELSKILPTSSTSEYMWRKADRIVKEIDKGLEAYEWAYQYAKENALHFVGQVGTEQLKQIEQQRIIDGNLDKLLSDADSFRMRDINIENYPILDISSEQWINPFSITMVYTVLKTLMDSIK